MKIKQILDRINKTDSKVLEAGNIVIEHVNKTIEKILGESNNFYDFIYNISNSAQELEHEVLDLKSNINKSKLQHITVSKNTLYSDSMFSNATSDVNLIVEYTDHKLRERYLEYLLKSDVQKILASYANIAQTSLNVYTKDVNDFSSQIIYDADMGINAINNTPITDFLDSFLWFKNTDKLEFVKYFNEDGVNEKMLDDDITSSLIWIGTIVPKTNIDEDENLETGYHQIEDSMYPFVLVRGVLNKEEITEDDFQDLFEKWLEISGITDKVKVNISVPQLKNDTSIFSSEKKEVEKTIN